MDIQTFNRRILLKQKQLTDLIHRRMPVLVGNLVKRHIEEDFRKGGFTDNGFHKWKDTSRQQSAGKGADARYGPLLSGRNHLYGSIEYTPGNGKVTVFTRVPYAGVHNRGGETHPPITPKTRRFAWAKHFEQAGDDKKKDTMWKRLALTKKQKLTVKIQKRQFMPSKPGPELTRKVNDKLNVEAGKIINS